MSSGDHIVTSPRKKKSVHHGLDRGGEEAAAAICLTHDRWGWAHSGGRIAYSQMGSPKLKAELRQINSSKWRFLPSSHLHHHFGMEGPAEHTKGVGEGSPSFSLSAFLPPHFPAPFIRRGTEGEEGHNEHEPGGVG